MKSVRQKAGCDPKLQKACIERPSKWPEMHAPKFPVAADLFHGEGIKMQESAAGMVIASDDGVRVKGALLCCRREGAATRGGRAPTCHPRAGGAGLQGVKGRSGCIHPAHGAP